MWSVEDRSVQYMDIGQYINEYIQFFIHCHQMYCSAAMNPEEREAYLKKKKNEAKLKLREMMKQKWADAKKV